MADLFSCVKYKNSSFIQHINTFIPKVPSYVRNNYYVEVITIQKIIRLTPNLPKTFYMRHRTL